MNLNESPRCAKAGAAWCLSCMWGVLERSGNCVMKMSPQLQAMWHELQLKSRGEREEVVEKDVLVHAPPQFSRHSRPRATQPYIFSATRALPVLKIGQELILCLCPGVKVLPKVNHKALFTLASWTIVHVLLRSFGCMISRTALGFATHPDSSTHDE